MRAHLKAALTVAAALGMVTSCTGGTPAPDDLSASLVRPDQLSGDWQVRPDDGTQVGGGFCQLEPTVGRSQPRAQAATVLVDEELLVRDTRLRYDADSAAAAYEVLSSRLAECRDDPENERLDVTVEPLPVPSAQDGRTRAFRLTAPVAGTVLVLDLAVWQQGPILGLTRLTHPSDTTAVGERLIELVNVAKANAPAG